MASLGEYNSIMQKKLKEREEALHTVVGMLRSLEIDAGEMTHQELLTEVRSIRKTTEKKISQFGEKRA